MTIFVSAVTREKIAWNSSAKTLVSSFYGEVRNMRITLFSITNKQQKPHEHKLRGLARNLSMRTATLLVQW